MPINDPRLIALQGNRVTVAWIILGAGGLLMLFDALLARNAGFAPFTFSAIGMLMGVLAMAWLSMVIKCPKCGLRLLPYSFSKKVKKGNRLRWLYEVEVCPRCAYNAKESPARNRRDAS